jgi:hypothetical protein
VEDFVAVLLDGLAANLGTGPGAKASRQFAADLNLHVRLGHRERLGVGVHRDEFDSPQLILYHPVDGVPSATTDTDHLHPRGLCRALFQLKDHGHVLGPTQKKS